MVVSSEWRPSDSTWTMSLEFWKESGLKKELRKFLAHKDGPESPEPGRAQQGQQSGGTGRGGLSKH